MQIEFLGIFDKFLKIPLMEVVAIGWSVAMDGGRRRMTMAVAVAVDGGGRPQQAMDGSSGR